MNPISSIAQISQIIKKRLRNSDVQENALDKAQNQTKVSKQQKQPQENTKDSLKVNIATELIVLPIEERLHSKGIQVLVKHILHWVFGSNANQEIKIQHVIEDVTQTIINDEAVRRDAILLIKEICSNK